MTGSGGLWAGLGVSLGLLIYLSPLFCAVRGFSFSFAGDVPDKTSREQSAAFFLWLWARAEYGCTLRLTSTNMGACH